MKKLIAALSLLFVLSLTACGNSDAALRQENEALRQQILALEAERDNLTKENKHEFQARLINSKNITQNRPNYLQD